MMVLSQVGKCDVPLYNRDKNPEVSHLHLRIFLLVLHRLSQFVNAMRQPPLLKALTLLQFSVEKSASVLEFAFFLLYNIS